MLAYILALAVGFGSLSLYSFAFLFPELYRKHDLIWSGIGLFYALVLGVCAGRITGGVLLGQIASVALLGGLGWQMLNLRLAQTPAEQRSHLPQSAVSMDEVLQDKWQQVQRSLEDGSWRVHSSNLFDRFPSRASGMARTLQSWVEALISTTLRPQEFSSPEFSSDAAQIPEAEGATAQTEITTSSLDPLLPTRSPTEPLAEFEAEWDDLEIGTEPELETIDESALEDPPFKSGNQH